MKLLDFKKWYEGKDVQTPIISGSLIESLSKNIIKVPKRMLYLEMDVLTENVNVSKSKNKIDRYYLKKDFTLYKENDISILESIIKKSEEKGTHLFLTSYDFTSKDPKKCYKNSAKLLEDLKLNLTILNSIPSRPFGSLENANESYQSKIDKEFYKQRIELIECYFNPSTIEESIQIPFYFNPNDHQLIEKYLGCLKGLMIQRILKNEKFNVNISVAKTIPNLKNPHSPEALNTHLITEMKYADPHKSSLLFPQNKPIKSDSKITILELTEKRANSVAEYLKSITAGMPINYTSEGLGYGEGESAINIAYSI